MTKGGKEEQFVLLWWSAATLDEARRVSRSLVERSLVACAQITPWIESIYRWNGEVTHAQESRVAFKLRREAVAEVTAYIEQETVYEVPEIIYLPITVANRDYAEWLLAESHPSGNSV